MKNGIKAFNKLLMMDFANALDIGSGTGEHADKLRAAGRKVTTMSLLPPADIIGDYLRINFCKRFDCIWASHVLEHQPNVNFFLKKCFSDLEDSGILAITVPVKKDNIVGGHLTIWNAGLLLYNLIIAGFDCSEASVKTDDREISVIVRKKHAPIEGIVMDFGDIEKIGKYFPFEAIHGFDGNITELNW